jgi:hypothetical protein
MLFKTLRGALELKLGRPASEAELRELEQRRAKPAQVPTSAGPRPSVLSAEERAFLEAARPQRHRAKRDVVGEALARAAEALGGALQPVADKATRLAAAKQAIAALPLELASAAARRGPKRFDARSRLPVLSTARAVAAALEGGNEGNLAVFGDKDVYVQQGDLDDLVPDGWGRGWPVECQRLGRRAGVVPLAVPLLSLLTFVSTIGERGAGFQVSLKWLARKLGCSTAWVKVMMNRLDPMASYRREVAIVRRHNARRRREGKAVVQEPTKPTGTSYLHRYRRLRRYADLPKFKGGPAAAWVDPKTGKVRTWVDQRGVVYVTEAGKELLLRRRSAALPVRARLSSKGLKLSRTNTPVELRPNALIDDMGGRPGILLRRLQVAARLQKADVPREVAPAETTEWPPSYPYKFKDYDLLRRARKGRRSRRSPALTPQ